MAGRIAVGFVLLLSMHSLAWSSGWNDYSLQIAPGYTVERMNSFEVCLAGASREFLICPFMYPAKVGPLVEYGVTPALIVTRHLGVRKNPENPQMEDGDPAKEFFFYVDRSTDGVVGPLARSEFLSHPEYPPSVNWIESENPNFWTPLLGNLMFLFFIMVYKIWPIALLISIPPSFSWCVAGGHAKAVRRSIRAHAVRVRLCSAQVRTFVTR